MKKIYLQILTIVLAFVFIFGAGGVYAAWAYAEGSIENLTQMMDIDLFEWTETPGGDQGEETKEEEAVRDAVADVLTEVLSGTNTTAANTFKEVISDRKGGISFLAPNEISIDDDPDAAALKELFGIDDDSALSAILRFTDDGVGYELYTTRIDLYEKDANDEYVIPDEWIENENVYLYPVNKTTFVQKTETVNGQQVTTVVEDKIAVGYSRCIWYYENAWTQTDIRSFDVTEWRSGANPTNADAIKVNVTGNFYLYGDIGQVGQTDQTDPAPVYFRRNSGTFGQTMSAVVYQNNNADGSYAFARNPKSAGNSYAALTYTPMAGGKNPSHNNMVLIEVRQTG